MKPFFKHVRGKREDRGTTVRTAERVLGPEKHPHNATQIFFSKRMIGTNAGVTGECHQGFVNPVRTDERKLKTLTGFRKLLQQRGGIFPFQKSRNAGYANRFWPLNIHVEPQMRQFINPFFKVLHFPGRHADCLGKQVRQHRHFALGQTFSKRVIPDSLMSGMLVNDHQLLSQKCQNKRSIGLRENPDLKVFKILLLKGKGAGKAFEKFGKTLEFWVMGNPFFLAEGVEIPKNGRLGSGAPGTRSAELSLL